LYAHKIQMPDNARGGTAGMTPPLHERIVRVTLNGRTGGLSSAAGWIQALNNPVLVREKGGFLFKASFNGDHLILEAAPALIQGARSYHYNMLPGLDDAFMLIGSVDAQGGFLILVKPPDEGFLNGHADQYAAVFRAFAIFLEEAGYSGAGHLDEITQGVLRKLGMAPPPQTLRELARFRPVSP